MNLSRTILHCLTDTSDKVYVIDINQLQGKVKKPYVVMTTWGKREAPRLSSQIKDDYSSLQEATRVAAQLAKGKSKTGYKQAAKSLKIPGLKATGLDLAKLIESNLSTPSRNEGALELILPSSTIRSIKI